MGELGGPVGDLADLLVELVDAGQPGAADGLVGGGDQANQTGLVVQRLEHRHRGHRGAVGVGDDALAGALAIASGLTSLTTSGTSGSIRHADELSITITPAAANLGASSRDEVAPDENKAMSRPLGSAVAASSTVICVPFQSRVVPAERAEAKKRICETGKLRSARIWRMTPPTWPVAPTTPIVKQANAPDHAADGGEPITVATSHQ